MRKKQINIALVGCGAVVEMLYLKSITFLKKEGLIGKIFLVDPNKERLDKISKLIPSSSFFDLESLFMHVIPDLCIIAAPHRFHAQLTIFCLDKGSNVLCEKPMATTVSECNRMISASFRNKKVLAVGHFRRFFPSCNFIKHILEENLLGKVKSFHFLEGESYSWPAQSLSFFKKEYAGGGVLIDVGVHLIDLLLWWLGDVFSFEYFDDAFGGVEANCLLKLEMKNGSRGIVKLSRDWQLRNEYIINCEKGWLKYYLDVTDRFELGLYNKSHIVNARILNIKKELPVFNFMDSFTEQLRNIIAAINKEEKVLVSGYEARKSIILIEKCYKKRKLFSMPWLEKNEQKYAMELNNES